MSRDLEAARQELTRQVMGRPGVTGTAVGERNGKPCLKVYVSVAGAGRSIPSEVKGYPVVVVTTGPFRGL
jgi:hypothetical protein